MFDASFRTKVLAPVIVVMVFIIALSMWQPNLLIKEQIRESAAEQVKTSEAALKITQQTRADELLLRYRNVENEPRVKAAASAELFNSGKSELDSDQQNTLLGVLRNFIKEGLCDVVVLTPRVGQPLAVAGDPQFNIIVFEASCSNSIEKAFQNQSAVETVQNNGRLFDVVTIPISVEDTNSIVGTITFGVENSMAQEFLKLTQSELVLLSDGLVVDSTLTNADLEKSLPEQFAQMTSHGQNENDPEQIILGHEHFLCLAGWLGEPGEPHRIGYLILSTYEKPLQALQSARQMILLVSFLSILFGAAVIWFLINRVTRPLRELRDSAEAVGRGDFSRRVPVRSKDECGELAVSFNQMTENVQQSRVQLEKTVETLKSTQAQLIQSEKLSAVGEFVAGVAHELNNPLAAVLGFSEMLKETEVAETPRRYLDMIYKSAQRCQKIVQSLLSFARRHQPEHKPVSVNKLVEAVLEIVAYPLRTSNIEVVTKFDPKLPVVMADEHQIQQVFLNIVNNARQALETHQPQPNGRIKITTETCEPNIRVIIQDNGPGIAEENLRRIFDPFFTTKEVGKGTGLGLSLCYGMIKEHGGNIKPSSRPGEGATFTIELPIAYDFGGAIETLPTAGAEKPDPREGAGKKILVIDDEESILQMIHDGLSRSGYRVDTVADGETALQRLKENHYDAVFCDWKMPGLNGRQVYERLRATNPGLCRRVIFITGDVINEQMQKFLEVEKRPCLAKPFKLAELRNVIKAVLAAL
jgi:signal transduction histidine kinase